MKVINFVLMLKLKYRDNRDFNKLLPDLLLKIAIDLGVIKEEELESNLSLESIEEYYIIQNLMKSLEGKEHWQFYLYLSKRLYKERNLSSNNSWKYSVIYNDIMKNHKFKNRIYELLVIDDEYEYKVTKLRFDGIEDKMEKFNKIANRYMFGI